MNIKQTGFLYKKKDIQSQIDDLESQIEAFNAE